MRAHATIQSLPTREHQRMNTALFSELTPEDIRFIASYGVDRTYPKKSILITKGDESDGLYVIVEGRVKVYISGEQGTEVILRYEGPGEFFGELALIDKEPRSASVATVEDTRVAYVSPSNFERCAHDKPDLAIKLLRSTINRIRQLTEELADSALKNVYQRIKSKLTAMAEEHDDKLMINLRLTHQDIADMVGCDRVMVTKILGKLTDNDYIGVEAKRISILKPLPRNPPA